MRDVPAIWDAWNEGGLLVGDRKPQSRVTVQPGWTLQTTKPVLGTWNRGPARWYQSVDHDLAKEVELPNVVSVNTERSLDTDAGSCDIVIRNVLMPELGAPEAPAGQFGNIGAFTWDHGAAQDAKARWQHVPNQWANVLVPNALLRTYQGYGGAEKTLEDAVADGNVVLTGVWLVDDVTIGTDGTVSVKCRDMAKLLIDQQLFPPLVPENLYPLAYKRWIFKETKIPADEDAGGTCYPGTYGFWDSMIAQIFDTTAAWHSSTDETYGEYNTPATGHPPSEAFDISYEPADAVQAVTPGYFSHQRSYWLSEPKEGPNDWVWIEFSIEGGASRKINTIYFHPLGNFYYVQVSVFENGEWIAPETGEGGTTVHGIPFVGTIVTPGNDLPPGIDTNQRPLPRDYNASRVRLTISNLQPEPEGGFRAGARKIMACFNEYSSAGTLAFAGGSIPVNNDNPQRIGYWQVRANGHVYAFGDARTYPANSPASGTAGVVTGFAVHPTGEGYWVLDNTGRVTSHGLAAYYGDLQGYGRTDAVDIAPAPDGAGYWILTKQGNVFRYGSAGWYADSTNGATMPTGVPAFARSIESHPSIDGYWVVWSDGLVTAHNLPYHGSGMDRTGMTEGEYVTCIRRTSTGNGYWILSGGGKVQVCGDAVHHGDANRADYGSQDWWKGLTWELLPSSKDDNAYAIMHADGKLNTEDGAMFGYGSIGEGISRQRFDGNYKDYTDIIRELLLWSGFYLYRDPQPAAEMPDVYGNLETTGAWSDADLPTDMFDKRPVMDAIRQIRDIVGYAFWIDAEGGARWESPNWWALGNYLIDGTPYGSVPEIDERRNLTQYSVVRSGSQARSRLIIANGNPMPPEPGKPPATGVIKTEITPRTASDLRGLLVPAMWTNAAFLKAPEQKVMAELIDLRSWFARRAGSITCLANPLIDINDQVRVFERQTSEVYIHYVRGINVSHDLESGSFTMTLTTYWLGGAPYGVNQLFRAGDTRPQRDGHWLATIGGSTSDWGIAEPGVYAYGNAQLYEKHEADSHLDLIVSMRSTPTGAGYYTLDRHGKILTYGDAVHRGEPLRTAADIADMALTPSGNGYWVVQEDGTVYAFGDAVHYGNGTSSGALPDGRAAWAEAIESHPSTQGYWILFNDGQVQAFNLSHLGDANRDRLNPIEYFTSLRRTESGDGYWILSAGGVVQGFGDAPERGDATRYPDENWVNGLCWTIIPGPSDSYAVVHSDANTETFSLPPRNPTGLGTDIGIVWSIVTEDAKKSLANPTWVFGVSTDLMKFLKNTGSPAAINAVTNGFDHPAEPTFRAL